MDELSSLFFEDTEEDDIQLLYSTVTDVVQGVGASSGFADSYGASGPQGLLVSDGSGVSTEEDSGLAIGWVGFADVYVATYTT